MILILDNYDSFTYNLAQEIGRHQRVEVRRNDEVSLAGIRRMRPNGIVISPGPGHPRNRADFGVCGEVIRRLGGKIPILGVCLGHQGIVHHLGGSVVRARAPIHGKTSRVRHDGRGVFRGLPNPLLVVRYHSLVADPVDLPAELEASAMAGGEIMAVRHRSLPLEGVQFHPESIGTQAGGRLLKNFVDACGRRN